MESVPWAVKPWRGGKGTPTAKHTRVSDSLLTQSPWCSLAGCCATEHFKLPASLFFLFFFGSCHWWKPIKQSAREASWPDPLSQCPLVISGCLFIIGGGRRTRAATLMNVHLSSDVSSIKTATQPTQAQGSEWTGHSWCAKGVLVRIIRCKETVGDAGL
jgi:hypothetical protein